jgi:hypothetical protein
MPYFPGTFDAVVKGVICQCLCREFSLRPTIQKVRDGGRYLSLFDLTLLWNFVLAVDDASFPECSRGDEPIMSQTCRLADFGDAVA